ncbi:hypothetical protein TPE_1133 [Treponema pedis str. T A4]|uniref:Uncharacterized protein n=2 Tax=Treponema pedis TaxID=409322 RepID=S6A8D3_9SPIR|nr:hypothetical protein TPE_1133 [Treponema pedis str. T A4]
MACKRSGVQFPLSPFKKGLSVKMPDLVKAVNLMDSTTEIDLDELLKDVVVPAKGGTGSASMPDSQNFSFNDDSKTVFPEIKTGGISKDTMFSNAPEAIGERRRDASEVDLALTGFEKIEKFYEDKPHTLFDSSEFYKTVLKGEGENAQRLHTALTKFLTATDPKDRGVFKQQVESAYWNFVSEMVTKIASAKASKEKQYAVRYGLVLPTLLTTSQKDLFAKIIDENSYCEAVYYLDEWFREIGCGKISPSATDEVKVSKKDDNSRFNQLLEKAKGKFQTAENLLRAKSEEISRFEDSIKQYISEIFSHDIKGNISGVKTVYSESQKQQIGQVNERLKKLLNLDKELQRFYEEYKEADADVRSLREKADATGGEATNVSGATGEYDTVRQMAKMTCGRKGNHFPILSREYFRSTSNDVGTRENVLRELRWIESIDVQAYCRQYKNQLNRIPPFVILLPTYGDIGFCWEPFDRYNRVTSRGRIAIPMYPKSLRVSLLMAIADLRWQVAKEKASYYWMEEGLTGNYYQWFQNQKLKGDIKEYFIQDYITWMVKESEGIQKVDKEVREVFWRYMPFSDAVKAKLKDRALVYQELCQRDLNRQMSDGY